jgi:hypothetical protein
MGVPFASGMNEDHETRQREVLDLLREAVMRSVGSQKAAAIEMGVDNSLLSRQLAGTERLWIGQIAKSPDVLAEFAVLLTEYCGHEVRRANNKQRQTRELRDALSRVVSLLDEMAGE